MKHSKHIKKRLRNISATIVLAAAVLKLTGTPQVFADATTPTVQNLLEDSSDNQIVLTFSGDVADSAANDSGNGFISLMGGISGQVTDFSTGTNLIIDSVVAAGNTVTLQLNPSTRINSGDVITVYYYRWSGTLTDMSGSSPIDTFTINKDDTPALNAEIKAAQQTESGIEQTVNPGDYAQSDIDKLNQAIAAAQAITVNSSASHDLGGVEAAVATLANAVAVFQNTVQANQTIDSANYAESVYSKSPGASTADGVYTAVVQAVSLLSADLQNQATATTIGSDTLSLNSDITRLFAASMQLQYVANGGKSTDSAYTAVTNAATTLQTDQVNGAQEATITHDIAALNSAISALGTAMNNLGTNRTVDYTALNSEIAAAQQLLNSAFDGSGGNYSVSELNNLVTALQAAESVSGNPAASQADVDQATANLANAANITSVPTDYSSLNGEITFAQNLETTVPIGNNPGDVRQSDVDTLNLAIQAAQAVASNPSATQDMVNAAFTTLLNAVTTFENSGIPSIPSSNSTDIYMKDKTFVTSVDNLNRTISVEGNTTADQLEGAIFSMDGSTQSYSVVGNDGKMTVVSGKDMLATGDELIVTAADQKTQSIYTITVGPATTNQSTTFQGASVDGNTLIINFSNSVTGNLNGADFDVEDNNGHDAVNAAVENGNTVTLTLDHPVSAGVVTVAYSGFDLVGADGNTIDFTAQTVYNSTIVVSQSKIQSISLDSAANDIVLTFSGDVALPYISPGSPPGSEDYSYLYVNDGNTNDRLNIVSATASGHTITLTTDAAFDDGDSVTVSYDRSTYNLIGGDGYPIDSFSINSNGLNTGNDIKLNGVSVSSNRATVGSNIAVSANIQGDPSTINGAEAEFTSPLGHTRDVSLTYNPATAKFEGVLSVDATLDPGTWTLSLVSFRDQAGDGFGYGPGAGGTFNMSFSNDAIDVESVDEVPPLTQSSTSGNQGNNGWYVGPVQLSLSATDNESGVAATYYSTDGGAAWKTYTDPVSFTNDGKYSIEYYSVDNTGNKETPQSVSFSIDQTPPSTRSNTSGNQGNNGWYVGPVQLSLSATDNESGVAATYYSTDGGTMWNTYSNPVSFSSDGKYSIEYYSVDNAGNKETPQTVSFSIDQTPPSTQSSTSGKQGTNGWYVAPVQLSLVATDSESGGATTYYSTDGGATWRTYTTPVSFSNDGKYSIEYYSVDTAGNKETTQRASFNIDQTVPAISVASPTTGTYLDDQSLTPTYSVVDNMSGVVNLSVAATLDGKPITNGTVIPLYTLSLGSHTLTVSASDNAGNSATQSVTFQVSTSVHSLKNLVSLFTTEGLIDNTGISNAVIAKLDAGSVQAFVNAVQSQSGKHINATVATYLLRDGNYLR